MAKQRQKRDGLSSIKFQRQALEFREKYTWVLVKADEQKIMAVIVFILVLIVSVYMYLNGDISDVTIVMIVSDL